MTGVELLLLAVVAGGILVALFARQPTDEPLVASFVKPLSGASVAEITDMLRHRAPGDPIVLTDGGTVYRVKR